MTNCIMSEIGARIRQLRKARGFTIEEAAALSGLHPNYLGDAERGRKNFSVGTLNKVAAALNIQLADLFSRKPLPKAPEGIPAEEARLLAIFRAASPEGREHIINAAKFIAFKKEQP